MNESKLPLRDVLTDDELKHILCARFPKHDADYSDAMLKAWRGSDPMAFLQAALDAGIVQRTSQPQRMPTNEEIETEAALRTTEANRNRSFQDGFALGAMWLEDELRYGRYRTETAERYADVDGHLRNAAARGCEH